MIDTTSGGSAFNRYINLDGIEDRVIYYLLSPNNKTDLELEQTYNIWKLLMYDGIDALSKPLPKYSDVVKLIANDNITQNNFRIFRSPHMEEAWVEQCSMLKIYIDSIIPQDRYRAIVNFGIDVICHNKIINVNVPDDEKAPPIDIVDGIEYKITQKSRISVLTKAVLYLLSGADIQGIGRMSFTQDMNRYQQAQYGIWNNRNFEGIKIVMGAWMSGVS